MTKKKRKKLDIHNYEKRMETFKKQLEELSKNNKEVILEFDEYVFLKEDLSIARRCKLMNSIYNVVVQYLKKDLEKATIDDIERVVKEIKSRKDYSPWTVQSYKAIIKKFYRWLKLIRGNKNSCRIKRNQYPVIVDWINTTIKKKDKPQIKASDLLTEDQVSKMVQTAESPRKKAFIFMLYELGARISEIGNLRVNALTKTKHGYQVFVNGKTGPRSPEIVISAPSVQEWLENHPLKDEENPPLWVNLKGKYKHKHVSYSNLRMMVKRHARKFGVKKRIYPHLFRHTRATHVVVNNLMNQSQAKKYFGWTPSSKVLDSYIHLTSKNANDSYKRSLGLIKEDSKKNGKRFNKKVCEICGKPNEFSNVYCKKCHNPLDMKTAQRDTLKREKERQKIVDDLTQKMESLEDKLVKSIEKRVEEREKFWYEKFKSEMKSRRR